MGVVTGLAALEPGPRAPGAGVLLDAALQAATGLQQLLAFRHYGTTVTTPAEQAAATAGLSSAAAGLGKAADSPARAHRAGRDDQRVRPYRHDGSQLSPARQGRQAPEPPSLTS